jgi:hypothetical protein
MFEFDFYDFLGDHQQLHAKSLRRDWKIKWKLGENRGKFVISSFAFV